MVRSPNLCLRRRVCANLRIVVPDMKLSPNVGSDRSWVWNAAADVSEGEAEAQTLAIRFANSESKFSSDQEYKSMNTHYLQTPTSSRKPSSKHSRRTRRSSARPQRSRIPTQLPHSDCHRRRTALPRVVMASTVATSARQAVPRAAPATMQNPVTSAFSRWSCSWRLPAST